MEKTGIVGTHAERGLKWVPILEGVPRGRLAQVRRQRLVDLALVSSDVLLAILVWMTAYALQDIWGRGELSEIATYSIAPNVVIWVGMRAVFGLYPGYGLDSAEELRRQTYAVAATLGVITLFALAFLVGTELSRLLIVVAFAGLALLAPLLRFFVRRALVGLGLWGRPAVVLGAGEISHRVVSTLHNEKALGFKPVAIFDDLSYQEADDFPEGVPYCGTLENAEAVAREYGIDVAIVAMPNARRSRLEEVAHWAGSRFRRVIVVPDLGGIVNSAMVARDLGGTFGVEIKHNLLDPWPRRVKRVVDLLGAIVGGLLICPLLLFAALLIRLDSSGPVIFKQQRLGAGNRVFRCWKFRTMRPDAEKALEEYLQRNPELRAEYDKYHKLRDDPRVTRVGRFLRKTSLDELPQLWNVLRGEMSLVGPRPYLPRESEKIGLAQGQLLRVSPGITGLWQVSGRNQTSFGDRVLMDAYYVRNWSVWLDLVILARTVVTVVFRRGAF